MRFYPTYADHLNNRPYSIMHSARFQNIALLLIDNSYNDAIAEHPGQDLMFDPYMEINSRVTIHQMILMREMGIGMRLVYLEESVEILRVLDAYVEEMRAQPLSDSVTQYLAKIPPFRTLIEGRVRYLIATDPIAAARYGAPTNPLMDAIRTIERLSAQSHPTVVNNTPLEQLLAAHTGTGGGYDN